MFYYNTIASLYTCSNNINDYIISKTRLVSCNNNKKEFCLLCQSRKNLQLDVRYKNVTHTVKTTINIVKPRRTEYRRWRLLNYDFTIVSYEKTHAYNVDEIDTWCQFHHHFMSSFFYKGILCSFSLKKYFVQLFSTCSLAL